MVVTDLGAAQDKYAGSSAVRRQLTTEQRTPAGRAGRPSEIAGLISFLAGPDAEFMTGSYLLMDGGLRDARGFNLPNVDAEEERQRHMQAATERRARLQPLLDER